MSRSKKLLLFKLATVVLLIGALLSVEVEAAGKKRKQGIDYSPCKVEVRVAGAARPGEDWASGAMEKAWKKEVKARFGEAFTNIENARDKRSRCYDGPLKTKRCEMIARPCEVRF